jgi:hypothetical protein
MSQSSIPLPNVIILFRFSALSVWAFALNGVMKFLFPKERRKNSRGKSRQAVTKHQNSWVFFARGRLKSGRFGFL